MTTLDLVSLRKAAGISQRELAEMLQVRQSFLSAIENGRSRLPEEKLDKIKTIFSDCDIEKFMIEEPDDNRSAIVPPHSHVAPGGDSLTELLRHIHDQAHRMDGASASHNRETELEERIDFLSGRNDRLSQRVDELRDEVDRLREENYRLKELLIANAIKF